MATGTQTRPQQTTQQKSSTGCRQVQQSFSNTSYEAVFKRLTDDERDLVQQVLEETAEYVANPVFTRRNADEELFEQQDGLDGSELARRFGMPTFDPIDDGDGTENNFSPLTAEEERRLFQKFNRARQHVFLLVWRGRGKRLTVSTARKLAQWKAVAQQSREQIVQANVPLVLAMAKRARLSSVDFAELISEGNMALLRSVDKFDCSRGFKFSTYACRAILKSFSRVALRTSRYRNRFPTEFDPTLEKSDYLENKRDELESDCVDELRTIFNTNMADLDDVERTVIESRFALNAADPDEAQAKTLAQVGELIGVTKERVRQIQNKALDKLKIALEESVLSK